MVYGSFQSILPVSRAFSSATLVFSFTSWFGYGNKKKTNWLQLTKNLSFHPFERMETFILFFIFLSFFFLKIS